MGAKAEAIHRNDNTESDRPGRVGIRGWAEEWSHPNQANQGTTNEMKPS